MTPLGIVGEPEDIAWAVLYLASEASRFVTARSCDPTAARRCRGDVVVTEPRRPM